MKQNNFNKQKKYFQKKDNNIKQVFKNNKHKFNN